VKGSGENSSLLQNGNNYGRKIFKAQANGETSLSNLAEEEEF
jgi:hypothetical protein